MPRSGTLDPGGRRAVAVALGAWLLGLALWWPAALSNADEALYVRQAAAFAAGSRTVVVEHALEGPREEVPSFYPPGTSALMAPLVRVLGWRGAFVVPALGLVVTVVALARGLERVGRSPRFALLVLGFPPAIVLARVAMSDVPAMAMTAVALVLLTRNALLTEPPPPAEPGEGARQTLLAEPPPPLSEGARQALLAEAPPPHSEGAKAPTAEPTPPAEPGDGERQAPTATPAPLPSRVDPGEGARGVVLFLLAGLLIGASSAVRDPAPLVLMPLVLGALVRERGAWGLVVGGLLGGALRLLGQWLLFGDALHVRGSYYGFSSIGVTRNAGLVLATTLVLVPGGLVALVGYRGSRRWELVAGVVVVLALMLCYEYGALESGALKRIVLGGRYALPALPLLVVMAAEAFPRLWARALARAGARRADLERAGRAVVGLWTAGVVVACFAVHATLGPWAAAQARIATVMHEATPDRAVVVTSWDAASKHLHELNGVRLPVDRRSLVDATGAIDEPALARALERGGGELWVVFVERDDSERWRANARENAAFLAALGARLRLEPVRDEQPTPTDRVRVWRARAPS